MRLSIKAEYFVVDGGFTDWTQQLLSNRKERLLISGMGSERFVSLFGRGDYLPGKAPANTADGTIAQEDVPMDKDAVLAKLRELKPAISARYKLKEIALFGSFVRGEQGSSSDIDLLAEFEADADLFDLIGLELYLEEIFQRPVDVVPKQALRVELRETVLHQVVTV